MLLSCQHPQVVGSSHNLIAQLQVGQLPLYDLLQHLCSPGGIDYGALCGMGPARVAAEGSSVVSTVCVDKVRC